MNVLWLSRHPPLPSQIEALKNKYGKIAIIPYTSYIPTAEFAIELVKKFNANIVVAVLPLSFIAHLSEKQKENNFTLLWAEMELLHRGLKEPCAEYNYKTDSIVEDRHFRFKKFKIIRSVEMITEEL